MNMKRLKIQVMAILKKLKNKVKGVDNVRTLFVVTLIVCALFFVPIPNVSALENKVTYIEEEFEDGSYIEVIIDYENLNARSTTTRSKTAKYKGEDGTIYWSITVKGTFTYDGNTSSCTSSSVSTKKLFYNLEIEQCKSFKKWSNSNC